MSIFDKKQMSEEDIKLNYITPALFAQGWKDKITMETAVKFTDGKVNLRGNLVSREAPKKADYVLYISKNNPIAIVEAKDNTRPISYGMQQAKEYAMAIQGKLVPQDPNDEPASVLLERIRAEKQRLIKEGKIKKAKVDSIIFKGEDNRHYEKVGTNEPICIEDELPFEIPDSWEWVRFSAVGFLKSGYAFKSCNYMDKGIQVVRISDLGENEILQKDAVYYSSLDELKDYLIVNGSFLICQTGSIGKMAWVQDNIPRYLNQRVGMFIPYEACNKKYIWYFLHTGFVLDIWISAKTSTNGNIKNSDILDLFFPMPPLAEQSRIVAEIEKYEPLIAEYNKLKQQKSKLDSIIYLEYFKMYA